MAFEEGPGPSGAEVNALFGQMQDDSDDGDDGRDVPGPIMPPPDEEEKMDEAEMDPEAIIADARNGFVGLKNQGATCYLNSLLQALYFTPELRQGLYDLTEEELGTAHLEEAAALEEKIRSGKVTPSDEDIAILMSLSGCSQSRAKRALAKADGDLERATDLLNNGEVPSVKKVIIELRNFFATLQKGAVNAISTSDLTTAFGWVNREVSQQHDAHELNSILLDAIERSLEGTSKSTLVNDIFQGKVVRRTLCLECENVTEREETFVHAMADVENIPGLRQSMESTVQPEFFVGDNQYMCERCGKKSDAKRTMAYRSLPPVIIVALKRFVFDLRTLQRVKYDKNFEFPLTMDWNPYMEENLEHQIHRTKADDEKIREANEIAERDRQAREERRRQREEREAREAAAKSEAEAKKKQDQQQTAAKTDDKSATEGAADATDTAGGETGQVAGDSAAAVPTSADATGTADESGAAQGAANEAGAGDQQQQGQQGQDQSGVVSTDPEKEKEGDGSAAAVGATSVEDTKVEAGGSASAVSEVADLPDGVAPMAPLALPYYGAGTDALPPEQGPSNYPGKEDKGGNNQNNMYGGAGMYASTFEEEEAMLARAIAASLGVDDGMADAGFGGGFGGSWDTTGFTTDHLGVGMGGATAPDTASMAGAHGDAPMTPPPATSLAGTAASSVAATTSASPSTSVPEVTSFTSQQELTFEQVLAWLTDHDMTGAGLYSETHCCWAPSVLDKSVLKKKLLKFILKTDPPERMSVSKWPSDLIILNADKYTIVKPDDFLKDQREAAEAAAIAAAADAAEAEADAGAEADEEEEDLKDDEDVPEEDPDDWSMRTDFSTVEEVSYLTNKGVLANADISIRKPTQLFLYIKNEFQPYAEEKYLWVKIPSARIGPATAKLPSSDRIKAPRRADGTLIGTSTSYGSGSRRTYPARGAAPPAPRYKLCESQFDSASKHLYVLTGVVIHRGTPYAGHYHAYIEDVLGEGPKKKTDEDITTVEPEKIESRLQNWYDFNDSNVFSIPTDNVAKQYGGNFECAYMLVYRHINALKSLNTPRFSPELDRFVEEYNKEVILKKQREAEAKYSVHLRVMYSRAFAVENEGSALTMRPFIASLLKQCIKTSRKKQKDNEITGGITAGTMTEEERREWEAKQLEKEDAEIDEAYLNGVLPEDLTLAETEAIVDEWFRENSFFVKVDTRKSAQLMYDTIAEKIGSKDIPESERFDCSKLSVHHLKVDHDMFNNLKAIADLKTYNVATHIGKRVLPVDEDDLEKLSKKRQRRDTPRAGSGMGVADTIAAARAVGDSAGPLSMSALSSVMTAVSTATGIDASASAASSDDVSATEEVKKPEEDSEESKKLTMADVKIRNLDLGKKSYYSKYQLLFAWNGKSINGIPFEIGKAKVVTMTVKHFYESDEDGLDEVKTETRLVDVRCEASLYDFWQIIRKEFGITDDSKEDLTHPLFTIRVDNRDGDPQLLYFGDGPTGKYDERLFLKGDFVQMINDSMNPVRHWQDEDSTLVRSDRRAVGGGARPRAGSYDGIRVTPAGGAAGDTAGVTRDDLMTDIHRSLSFAPLRWRSKPYLCFESSKGIPNPNEASRASTDWMESTQFCTIKIENRVTDSPKEVVLKMKKGVRMESVISEFRKRSKCPSDISLRLWQLRLNGLYLVKYTDFFNMDKQLMIEEGKYALLNEKLLQFSVALPDKSFLPFVSKIISTKSNVKKLKPLILKLFGMSEDLAPNYTLWSTTADGHKLRSFADSNLIDRMQALDGECFMLIEGTGPVAMHRRRIYLVTDSRTLHIPWDFTNVGTVQSIHGIESAYFSESVTTLECPVDITYDGLREMIGGLTRFSREVSDWKRLRLGWYDAAYNRPLSFPLPCSGKMKGQKKWEGKDSCLSVEVVSEPFDNISKFALCLHCFLARRTEKSKGTDVAAAETTEPSSDVVTAPVVEDQGQSQQQQGQDQEDIPANAQSVDVPEKGEKGESIAVETTVPVSTADSSVASSESSKKIPELEYWPPTEHIRLVYDPAEPKLTWKDLRRYLADEFQLKEEHTYCAMYKVTKKEWSLLDDSSDESDKALAAEPWNIKPSARDNQVLVVFEEESPEWITDTILGWAPPPLAGKAQILKSQRTYVEGPYSVLPGAGAGGGSSKRRGDGGGITIAWD